MVYSVADVYYRRSNRIGYQVIKQFILKEKGQGTNRVTLNQAITPM